MKKSRNKRQLLSSEMTAAVHYLSEAATSNSRHQMLAEILR